MTPDRIDVVPHDDHQESSEACVLDLIRSIKSKELAAKSLNTEDRRACVEHLSAEGLSVPEIAKVLERSDRTIARDRKVIQQRNALDHDPAFAGEMAGRLMSELDNSVGRIRRAARGADVPPAVRIDAERACVEILCKIVERVQSMGYLPTAASRIEATLRYEADMPSWEVIGAEMQSLNKVVAQLPAESGIGAQVAELADQVARGSALQTIENVKAQAESGPVQRAIGNEPGQATESHHEA